MTEGRPLWRAILALEGSISGAEGLRQIRDYCRYWTHGEGQRALLEADDESKVHELFIFLSELARSCDPDGHSRYRVKVTGRTQNAPKPSESRTRNARKADAALRVDALVRSGMPSKQAEHLVTTETKVSHAEQHKARKGELYRALRRKAASSK